MNINRDNSALTSNAFSALIDSSAAAAAAERIYRSHDGLRHCVDTQACLTAEEARAKDAREGRQFNPVQFVEPMSAGVSLERHDDNMQAFDTDEYEMDAEGNTDDHLIDLGDEPEFDVDTDLLMDLDDTVLIDEVAEEVF
jgi:hypothetical protein